MVVQGKYDVVISGVGGYFASCKNIEVFQEGLLNNENLMTFRWKAGERGVTNVIGRVPTIERFDASYFGIHREQSNLMDPMQRMVLERTYEALIDAGVNPVDLRGKKIAVFGGASVGENDNLFYEVIASGFGITGHSRSMMPNRVSYWLNVNGPSCAYDNNWLNGIEVLQSAYEVVRTGQCEAAIVATANLALNSEISWHYNDMGMLSPDGTTRSFDANANGYGRSDGIIALYIQRACDAKRSYATILGLESRFNGQRDGPLRDVNVNDMANFIKKFYDDRKIDPRDVEFVECYGCGHKNIDEAELEAIDRVYCKNRENPLLVGSVKPNTGHAEASAVLTSLVKVLIAMETGTIPANINYDKPNPKIDSLVKGRIEVVSENKEWGAKLAAINGIGLGSSYGHILLKSNPKLKEPQSSRLPRLINISTRTEEGIQDIVSTLKAIEKVDPEYAFLIQDTFKKSIPGHLYRAYAVLDSTDESKTEFQYFPGNKREVWFVYSGMGSQWCKMACDLMALPIFASAIHKCHKILEPKGIDLLTIVTSDDEKMFENILHSFVGIAAVQIGLTDVLHSIGIVPDGIIGHSVGELGCAYADGCLSAEQMILCAYSRGKASLEASLIKGMMAAIGMGYQHIKDQCPPSIEVACHNGPDSSTISGPTEDMEAFVQDLQDKKVFAKLVNVSNIAYHSRYIKPAAPLLLKYLKKVIPNPLPRSSKWISTSIVEEQWNTDLAKTSSAEYHTNNLLSSVLFEEGSKHIPKEAICIEIAPHGLLQAILKRSLKANTTNIPLTQKTSKNGLTFLLGALGKLYLEGVDLNLSALYPEIEYPVSRGTRSLTSLVHWEHSESWRSGLQDKLNTLACAKDIDISLKSEEYKELTGHEIQNTVVLPTSAYLAVVYEIFNGIAVNRVTDIIFEDLRFKNVFCIPKLGRIQYKPEEVLVCIFQNDYINKYALAGSVPIYIMVQKGSGSFEISSGSNVIGTGRICNPETENLFTDVKSIEVPDDTLQLTANDVYSEFYHRSHKYREGFKLIRTLWSTKQGSISKTEWNNNWLTFIEAMFQQYLFHEGERHQNALTITAVKRIVISLSHLPTEPSDLEVTHNYATGIISTPGIQISGINARSLNLENQTLSYNAIELNQLSNAKYQSIESGINLGLQLVMDNFEDKTVRSIMIVEICTKNPLLEDRIKNVINKNSHLKASISIVEDSKDVFISQTQPVYVIVNREPDKDCINLVTSSHIFLLARTGAYIFSNHEIAQIAEFSVDGISYSLIKKNTKLAPVIVSIKPEALTAKDLLCKKLPWVSQLKSAIVSAKSQKVYLVSHIVPLEGINNFFQNASKLPNMQNIRFVFVLDRNGPEFTASEPAYQKIFKNELVLSVIKNGCVGTYISAPIEFEDIVQSKFQAISNIIANTRLDYLGINVKDETLIFDGEYKPELGNIDFSGVTSSGERVMGIGHLDLDYCKFVPDPILCWNVPSKWSLEDAVTTPNAYALAYYALVEKARIKPSETVLVHGGCTALGLSAIHVAAKIGCSIFTTVTSNKQKAFMKKQFMFMKDRNIFQASNTSFEPHLLIATGGDGAHVVLNCLSGSMLNATIRCVTDFGKIVQIGELDVEQNKEIGMRVFLKNVSLHNVSAEDIISAPLDVKQKIHKLVANGLKTYIVRPLFRNVVHHQDIKSILSTLKQPEHIGKIVVKLSDNLALNQLHITRTCQFICDPKHSYLVYGGAAETWIDVVEWLLFRGARKIVVSSGSIPSSASIHRRLSLYQSYYNLELVITTTSVGGKDKASELVSKAYRLGPIDAVFILPSIDPAFKTSEIKAVQCLDCELKRIAPQALLINFLNTAAGICQLRTDVGFKTHNIQWESGLEFSKVLYTLDEILSFKVTDIMVKKEKSEEIVEESAQSLYKKLNLLLPNSIDRLKEEAASAPTKPDFILLPSLCDRNEREVPPIFVFPRLFSTSAIENLASKVLYPVYCATFPKTSLSLKAIAAILANKLIKICPKGPYNLVGVSYGGVLAIEVAKVLEQDNRKTSVQLLDGAPDTVQGAIRHLGKGSEGEIGFLCRILNLTNPEIMEELNNLPNWESRLKFALKHYECSLEDKVFLGDILTTLKRYLDEVCNFGPTQALISGQISLLRPTDSHKYDTCGLPKYCKQNAQISLIDGNHTTILTKKATINFINNKVIC